MSEQQGNRPNLTPQEVRCIEATYKLGPLTDEEFEVAAESIRDTQEILAKYDNEQLVDFQDLTAKTYEQKRSRLTADEENVISNEPLNELTLEIKRMKDAVQVLDEAITRLPYLDTERALFVYMKGLSNKEIDPANQAVYIHGLNGLFDMDPVRAVQVAQMTEGLEDPASRERSFIVLSEILNDPRLPKRVELALQETITKLDQS